MKTILHEEMLIHPILGVMLDEKDYLKEEYWQGEDTSKLNFIKALNCKEYESNGVMYLTGKIDNKKFTLRMSIRDYRNGKNWILKKIYNPSN